MPRTLKTVAHFAEVVGVDLADTQSEILKLIMGSIFPMSDVSALSVVVRWL